MSEPRQDLLSTLLDHWRAVAEETTRCLGEETAGLFVYLWNDALAILGAISDAYPEGERLHSLLFNEFTGLFKDLNTLEVLFRCGNYRLVLSQLRFNWERIFRARFADAYPHSFQGCPQVRGALQSGEQ